MVKKQNWSEMRSLPPEKMAQAIHALEDVRDGKAVETALRDNTWNEASLHKSALVAAYHQLVESGEWEADENLLAAIRLKPVRTLSGVTTVTVLTKPYPCPGKCIFCPDDVRMPKSYLPDEPGAMRALEHNFDPYTQVRSRLEALTAVGHPTDKVELLILGGTFSAYRRDYQEWFVKRCFQAMNGSQPGEANETRDEQIEASTDPVRADDHESLAQIHFINESAPHRNVGLSIETRPDEVTLDELTWLRSLGVTKVQMGVQNLDDRVLALNLRGHTVAEAHRAVALLRAAGFKIVLHWMPNLLGATQDSDRADFPRLWEGLCPDEIKIYPTQLLENSPLYGYWQRGEYHPYDTDELVTLIADVKPSIPRYCRVNRIIRDIPSTHVIAGNKRTSLRQDVTLELARRGTHCNCIRCREVRGEKVDPSALQFDDLVYAADGAEEHFLSFVTAGDQIAGFLRLSLPMADSPATNLVDLEQAAIIREVHVYGQALALGTAQAGASQHSGLGTRLMLAADKIAREKGYRRMAVIAAVGTRQYYLERGFERGNLYLVKTL
jgi:elongator complex protein 3